jgi:hypothetical protein
VLWSEEWGKNGKVAKSRERDLVRGVLLFLIWEKEKGKGKERW